MIKIKSNVIYKNFIFKKYFNSRYQNSLKSKYSSILDKIIFNLDSSNNTLHSLSKEFRFNFKNHNLKRFRIFKTIVVIGMGGSILGSKSIYFSLQNQIKKNFIFLDNIDEEKIKKIKKEKKINKILFMVISKSGNTLETLSNLLALKIIKANPKNLIIISENNNNALSVLSKKMRINFIEHKKYIPGRYSVLSEVGMVPAYLMGLNIFRFRKNLQVHMNWKNKNFLKNSSIILSDLIKSQKLNNIVLLSYDTKLNSLLYWIQQLIAESLGKNGKGFFPTVSKAPKDHHSLLQLYLDGPKDKLFYIFSKKENAGKKLSSKILDKKFSFLNNKTLRKIKKTQKDALIKILKKNKIPFREFEIKKDLNEEILGELFSYFMLETALVGKMAKINPFNQPAVEQIKIITKNLLN